MARQIPRMTVAQLRAEIARRQMGLPKLQKKRAKLLRTIGALDRQIAALGGLAERPAKRKGRPAKATKAAKRTKVAKRAASSGKSLGQSIKDVLGGSRGGMRVKNIVAAVLRAGYKTAAKDFYNMVAAALRGDGFKRLGRGVYKLKGGKVAKGRKAAKAGK